MKNVISLGGVWQLVGFEKGQGDWAAANAPRADVIEATVPGDVHMDLAKAGIIPDPFYGTNAKESAWVARNEWWYKRSFDLDEDFRLKRTFLEFEDLDDSTEVHLNGRQISPADTLFPARRFDVTEALFDGPNTIAIRLDAAEEPEHALTAIGIMREPRVVSFDRVAIGDVRVEAEIEGIRANAWVSVEIENFTGEDQTVSASIVVARGEAHEKIDVVDTVTPFGGVFEAVIRIEEPELWRPNGLGEQPIYRCLVGLQIEDEVQDVAEQRFGVRTVEMRENLNAYVTRLAINGEDVFCKGGEWFPPDLFEPADKKRCRRLVRLAKEANFNMLRVKTIERQEFYSACDEMGIMVWQDLPNDPAKCAASVKRLRGYVSIVAWSGNDEEVVKNVLGRLDHSRPFRRVPPRGLAVSGTSIFTTGIAGQGPPVIESLRRFLPENSLLPRNNEFLDYHSVITAEDEESPLSWINLLERRFGAAESPEQFAAFAGVFQGEAAKSMIEYCRWDKRGRSAALLAAFSDHWPGISGSIVDYYLCPKIAYYYVKRAFAPLICCFNQPTGRHKDRMRLYLISDERINALEATLRIGILSLDTNEIEFQSIHVSLPPNSSQAVWESELLDTIMPNPTRQCLVALLESRGEIIARDFYFARPLAEMEFPQPKLLVEREQISEKRHRMVIAANGFARNVAIGGLPECARPSDNYFDLIPGERYEVIIRNITQEQAKSVRLDLIRR